MMNKILWQPRLLQDFVALFWLIHMYSIIEKTFLGSLRSWNGSLFINDDDDVPCYEFCPPIIFFNGFNIC
jgi:hypothetical protein